MKEELIGCTILDENPHTNLEEMMELYLSKGSPETYYVKDKSLQCDGARNRSFDDLLLLSKNYYPDTTIEELVNTVSKIIVNSQEDLMSIIYYCGNIDKPVVWKRSLSSDQYRHRHNKGFYGECENTINNGKSQWSCKELHNMIDK